MGGVMRQPTSPISPTLTTHSHPLTEPHPRVAESFEAKQVQMTSRYCAVAGPSTTGTRTRVRGEIYQYRICPLMLSADDCTRDCWQDGVQE
jgi:hypothetical protein